jgi:cytidylate kinase
MKLNEKFVITINRELGSGGHTVGQKLSEKLGVPFYDKALIQHLQEKYHLTVEEIEKLKGQKHDWWSNFKRVIGMSMTGPKYYQVSMDQEPELITTEEMFKSEQEILKGIAEAESCIVAGRSGFYVFRKHPNHLSILIQASMDFREKRVARKQGITTEEARKIIDKVDEMRENYISKYAKTSRYDARNYDLVIAADGKTEDEIVDFILDYMGK